MVLKKEISKEKKMSANTKRTKTKKAKNEVYVMVAQPVGLLGPCGMVAIKEKHCPAWIKESVYFREGDLNAQNAWDDEALEIARLIKCGHARIVENLRYINVSATVMNALGVTNW